MIGPVGRRVNSSIRPRTLEYLVTSSIGQGEPEDARAGAAVLGWDAESEEVRLAELVEEVLWVLAGRVDLASAWLHLLLGEASHAALEFGELFWQFEVHTQQVSPKRTRLYPPGRGATG